MPLHSRQIGASTPAITHDVDARWLMAYAAGLGDLNPCYLDTSTGPVCAHPLFPVCLEWPAILAARDLPGSESLTREERLRGVHAAHDLHIYRQIRAGERLATRATVMGARETPAGAALLLRLDTADEHGALVCRTYQLSISRGVALEGGAAALEHPPKPPALDNRRPDAAADVAIPVPAGLAHVYTECARIWNPIHTDRAVALSAGLPDIILHGTATLALAVSRLVDGQLGGDPARVARVGGRFTGMVMLPSTLTLQLLDDADQTLFFRVRGPDGGTVFDRGFLCYV
jgi:acyl dehydratase